MIESTHVLNRTVCFTEIPGAPRLPEGTRLVVRKAVPHASQHEVTAITPSGQRFEFRSTHIGGLIKTPWVSPIDPTDGAIIVPAATPVAKPVEVENPFTIGDVTSVEEGVGNDQIEAMDVTGSSMTEKFEIKPKETEEIVATPAIDTSVEIRENDAEVIGIDMAPDIEMPETETETEAKGRGRKKAK